MKRPKTKILSSLLLPLSLLSGALFSPATTEIVHAAPRQKADDAKGTVSFLVISGIHQGEDGRNPLAELLDRAGSLTVKPNFVVGLGDVTKSGETAQFDALAANQKTAATAGISFYAVPGTRDVGCFGLGREHFNKSFAKTYQSFDISGIHFLLLDSTVPLQSEGHLDKIEMDWLDRDLKRIKPEAPIFVFLYHSVGQATPAERSLDNDYELLFKLRGRNVTAMFTGDTNADTASNLNSIPMFTQRNIREGSIYQVSVTQLIANVDRIDLNKASKPVHLANVPTNSKSKGSLLRVTWDDPDIPFLERRRPAATLSPRAVADNPDKERAVYRIDSGPWKLMTKDRRDIWSDSFLTKDISIGMHSADVRLTTSNDIPQLQELIFEVERDNKEPTRKWAFDLPAGIVSSPVLSAENLYVSCEDGKLYAINATSGKRKWFFTSKGSITASPIEDTGTVFVGSTDRTFYAVENAGGKMKWHVDTDSPIFGAAAVARKTICFASGDKVYGVGSENGVSKWNHPVSGPIISAIGTDGNNFYVASCTGMMYGFDAASGNELWHSAIGGSSSVMLSAPCASASKVYVAATDGFLHCLDAAHGNEIWAKSAPVGEDAIGLSGPAINEGNVIVCGNGKLGSVIAFEANSGAIRWHVQIGQPIRAAGIRVAANGRSIALMGLRGKATALNASNGKELWAYELGPGNIYSVPEYDGNTLYTTTMGNDVQAINGPGVVSK